MRNQAQVLLKRSCMLGKLVNTQSKGLTLLCIGKIIFVSVAFLLALSIHVVISLPDAMSYFKVMLIFTAFILLEDEGFFIVIFHYPNEDSPLPDPLKF